MNVEQARFNMIEQQIRPWNVLDPTVLAQGSKSNATLVSAGFSFTHSGVRRDGRVGLPLDAMIRGQMVIGSNQGRVNADRSVVFGLRVYAKIF